MNKIFMLGALFFVASIYAMDPVESKFLRLPLVQSMPLDIEKKIESLFSLQDIGRVISTSQACRNHYGQNYTFCQSSDVDCGSMVCHGLKANYYACSRALGWCAKELSDLNSANASQAENKNEIKKLFNHWWSFHHKVRNASMSYMPNREIGLPVVLSLENYHSKKKTKRHIREHCEIALIQGDWLTAVTLLSGDAIDLFDEIKNSSLKERLVGDTFANIHGVSKIVCETKNSQLILTFFGKYIDKSRFKYILPYISSRVLEELIDKNHIVIDKTNFLHYLAQYGHYKLIPKMLSDGFDVNCLDACGRTPLHYAVKGPSYTSVMALINNGANLLAKNQYSKRPIDYVSTMRYVAAVVARDDSTSTQVNVIRKSLEAAAKKIQD